ncbi:hypothetical protein QVA66_10585 [Staphylococcus chromogenes]|nr:hypothetical protein [Staphylococcus chromogenes]
MRSIFHFPLVVLAWAVTRWIVIRDAYGRTSWIFGDVSYYFSDLTKEKTGQIALREYPEANLWLLRPLARLIDATQWPPNAVYIGFVLVLDAIFLAALVWGKHWRGTWFWVAFGLVAGPIFVSRLDIVPGMLVGLVALFLASHPKVASALLALATMMKLWPGVLATALVGPARATGTWLRTGVFMLSITLLAGVTVVTQGLDRLLSPLDYQNVRGLQIESVAATPFMVLASARPGTYHIQYAASKSFEIAGQGVSTGVSIASWSLYAVVLLAAAEVVRRLLAPEWNTDESVALAVLLVIAILVTNKVLSPQYLMWLGPILAVALSRSRALALNVLAVLSILCAYLTYLVFPKHYGDIIGGMVKFDGIMPLLLRNVVLVIMLVIAALWWWREHQEGRATSGNAVRESEFSAPSADCA